MFRVFMKLGITISLYNLTSKDTIEENVENVITINNEQRGNIEDEGDNSKCHNSQRCCNQRD